MKKIFFASLCIISIVTFTGCSIFNTVEDKTAVSEESIDEPSEESVEENDARQETVVNSENAEQEKEEVINIPKKTVVIDPGHGAGGNSGQELNSPNSSVMKIKDPGGAQGVNSKVPEYKITLQVSVKLKALLEANNINVVMTKTEEPESPGNIDRANVANDINADLAIRIHCDSADSSSANGASMLVPAKVGYAVNISDISRQYGKIILDEMVSSAGMYSRGVVEREDLTGFNWSKVPVVLVEMGFISNSNEDRLLNTEDYQNKVAQGLANGIISALNGTR